MASCCCKNNNGGDKSNDPLAWFGQMIPHCLEYAQAAKAAGKPVVGILCEYTPRELIMAAGGVPVCLCGGSAKTIPAAEQHLPANLCPLIKSTYGYHVLRNNPFLEMADLVVGETTCDGKKKMYELMAESRPMYVLELPHRSDESNAMKYWLQELQEFRTFLSDRFSTDVSDQKIREATVLLNRERALRRNIAALMQADRPTLTGRQVLDCKSSIWGMPDAQREYERVVDRSEDLLSQPLECCSADRPHPNLLRAPTEGWSGEGTVRVLMTGVPLVHGAERVLDIIEQSGGLVVAMENCTGLKPLLEDIDETAADPLLALAEKYFHLPCSVMTPNNRRLDTLRQMATDYRAECIVELVWQACLTYDVESHRVKRFAEEQLGLPYLHIETDYSPSDSPRIALRVEALLETVRSQRP